MAAMKIVLLLVAAFLSVNAEEAKKASKEKADGGMTYTYSSGPIITSKQVVSHQVVSGGSYQVVQGGSTHTVVSSGSTTHVVHKPVHVVHKPVHVVHKPVHVVHRPRPVHVIHRPVHVVHRPRPVHVIHRPVHIHRPRPVYHGHGGCYVEIFQHINFGGVREVYRSSTGRVHRNDDMSSLKVPRGCCVTIYEHVNYRGKSQRYCGRPVKFVGGWWNDKMSSLRVSGHLLGGGGGGACRADLYQHVNFGGVKDTYRGNVPRVRRNDDMSSLKVGGGCCVVIYEHVNYRGRSQKYCRSTKWIGKWWNDKVSSVKVVRGDEPEEEFKDVTKDVTKDEATKDEATKDVTKDKSA